VKPLARQKKHSFDPEALPCEGLKKIALAFDQMDAMAGIADTVGNVLFANQSASKNVGTTLEEVKGLPFRNSLGEIIPKQQKK